MSIFITIGNNIFKKQKIDFVGIIPDELVNVFVIPSFQNENSELTEKISDVKSDVKINKKTIIKIIMGRDNHNIPFNTKAEAVKELKRIKSELDEEKSKLRISKKITKKINKN